MHIIYMYEKLICIIFTLGCLFIKYVTELCLTGYFLVKSVSINYKVIICMI